MSLLLSSERRNVGQVAVQFSETIEPDIGKWIISKAFRKWIKRCSTRRFNQIKTLKARANVFKRNRGKSS